MFGKVLDKFSASLVKKSVGRKYAADSEEEAEWDGFCGVVWVAQCLWPLYGDLFRMWLKVVHKKTKLQ